MSQVEVLTFVVLLVGVLLVIVALMVWQEARRRPSYEPLEYVLNDAVKHVAERLPADAELRNTDVRRILEWEVFYLQGLAQDDRHNPVETVAGGHPLSVDYIADQIRTKHGVSYSPEQIEEVLRLEADYLVAIGAVGEAVGEEE
ncbi:MAG TPA: hypothetical protein VG872_04530 [Acidimicrobiia bacterium]|jgi:hypothetical protein|nr:hypothetical protein [Acidimicrobiia bacterium]